MPEIAAKEVDTIVTFLSAYPGDRVRAALRSWIAYRRGERLDAGWKIYTGAGDPPAEAGDKMQIGSLWYTRERPPARLQARQAPKAATPNEGTNGGKKTDLSMKPTDRKCPTCGEVMAWEPICPGCALGRLGFAGRYVCMDDMTHEFYVTKPGVELSNQ